jgi:hypothetical protein
VTGPRVPCRAVRALLPAVVAVLTLVGCSSTPSSTPTADAASGDRAEVLADLRDEVADVAEDQAAADRSVNDVLEVVRAVEESVAALRGHAGFDAALDDHATVHDRVEGTRVGGLRDGYLRVAEDVDDARQALASARARLDDPWEQEYLDAQDAVLLAVREYARTADQLAQLLEQHWPTYVDVDAEVAAFAARRGNYRDEQEAADAFAVELEDVLGDLTVAEAQVAEYRTRRTAAGQAVNEASADALAVWERRAGGAAG